MDLNELFQFVVNNGIAVVLMFYFLKNNNKATNDLISTTTKLIEEQKQLIKSIDSSVIEMKNVKSDIFQNQCITSQQYAEIMKKLEEDKQKRKAS
jgi:hypothetical protein